MSEEAEVVSTSNDVTDAPEPTPVTIVEKVEPSLDDDLAAVWDKANKPEKPRAADGKFAPRDGGNDDEQAAEESGEELEAGQPEGEEAEAETPPIEVPSSWPAEMQERFQALPPEFRDIAEFAAQREHETGEALEVIGQDVLSVQQELMRYEPFDQVANQFQHVLDRHGIQHPAQALHYLLNAQDRWDQNPLGSAVHMLRASNIDLEPLLRSAGVQVQLPQQAPQVEPYVAALQSKVQQLEGMMTAQQQAQYQAEEQRLNSVIEDFAKGKQYFDEVRPVMAALLQGGQATDLATAYDMAINASPTVRARIQRDEEAKRIATQKAKAEQARKSTAVNVKSGTPGPSSKPKSWVDTLSEVARKHYG